MEVWVEERSQGHRMDVVTADNIMNLTAFFSLQGVVVMRLDVYGVCILIFGDEIMCNDDQGVMAGLILRDEGRSFLK